MCSCLICKCNELLNTVLLTAPPFLLRPRLGPQNMANMAGEGRKGKEITGLFFNSAVSLGDWKIEK